MANTIHPAQVIPRLHPTQVIDLAQASSSNCSTYVAYFSSLWIFPKIYKNLHEWWLPEACTEVFKKDKIDPQIPYC